MEWIETTGKTVDEAKQRALDELGIDESELEFEVLQEPRGGFLGRLGGSSAHVRARVRPVSREKPDRRRRGQGGRDRRGGRGGRGERSDRGGGGGGGGARRREPAARQDRERERGRGGQGQRGRARSDERAGADGASPRAERAGSTRRGEGEDMGDSSEERGMSDVPIEEQVQVAREFTQGLVDAFGLDTEVQVSSDDEDHLRIEVDGDDVGVLIGRNGGTMEAIRELIKTALQRQTEGHNARVSVDVGGYGARRREALEGFARELAQKAVDTGRPQVLEPMTPPDRKVVHDAVSDIEGVTTASEGEEPRRRVIIQPA